MAIISNFTTKNSITKNSKLPVLRFIDALLLAYSVIIPNYLIMCT